MADLNPDNEKCARCGERALGLAHIQGLRYCHDDVRPCYQEQLWDHTIETLTIGYMRKWRRNAER